LPPFDGPEWKETRLDIDPGCDPDIVADMCDMKGVASAYFDGLWSSHNLEHVYWHDLPRVLGEFNRVLKPRGLCGICVPDLQRVAEYVARDEVYHTLYEVGGLKITPFDMMFGCREIVRAGNAWMSHKGGFTATTLAGALFAFGFGRIRITRLGFDIIATCVKLAVGDAEDEGFLLCDEVANHVA
jgi:ubiquinone/menaquinone biosynthesis C-methylase UbiE